MQYFATHCPHHCRVIQAHFVLLMAHSMLEGCACVLCPADQKHTLELIVNQLHLRLSSWHWCTIAALYCVRCNTQANSSLAPLHACLSEITTATTAPVVIITISTIFRPLQLITTSIFRSIDDRCACPHLLNTAFLPMQTPCTAHAWLQTNPNPMFYLLQLWSLHLALLSPVRVTS